MAKYVEFGNGSNAEWSIVKMGEPACVGGLPEVMTQLPAYWFSRS
ncbi:MAG TPA: hypothetical protein VJW94_16640 [Candidatus Acidoferrum sp.]|nr:hypothetical protein [Candidatus Acidoferrum sp.]